MAQARNNFVQSKMNKDLDARLLPGGEYRDARNVQVSKSEGANVGALENVLGNEPVLNINTLTASTDQKCIGQVVDDSNNFVYLFTTNRTADKSSYSPTFKNFIIRYDAVNQIGLVLVKGNWLNFSSSKPIHGINLLEGLLFWTDNRNQPRVINVNLAAQDDDHYNSEDQISVAKYNPYESMQLWQEAAGSTDAVPYETTMKDVTSLSFPNGCSAICTAGGAVGVTTITVTGLVGEILFASLLAAEKKISFLQNNSGVISMVSTGGSVATAVFTDGATPSWLLGVSGITTAIPANATIVVNPNTYFNGNFAGDPNFLEDKFVRFSYRYKFEDNQYSIFAPFTQAAFIPKQDGYFMYVKNNDSGQSGFTEKLDEASAYRSTVVSFMENKVDSIKLRIPLPTTKTLLSDALKITEMDILFKESNGLAVKVIDTISIADLKTATPLIDPNIFVYEYNSKKPYKTLPSDNLTRVYDKIPVRALAQEVSGNRVMYGNFQNQHTPPDSIDYSVSAGAKQAFELNIETGKANGTQTVTAGDAINIKETTAVPSLGSIATATGIPDNATVTEISATVMKLDKDVTLADNVVITFNLVGPDTDYVSKVEYPNSTLKQNRNYQVGIMLSDRYGRTSTVVLSNNEDEIIQPTNTFTGDTIYSAYLKESVRQDEWPGNSLKVLFNQPIGPVNPIDATGWPGIYNGDDTSNLYNPLGWYSYKIVVKQTEQEYYNVYLPGIMASYPEDIGLELGQTSHMVLINDNINKVPRDLTEVGPEQRQFRSSVNLFGRVNNTAVSRVRTNGVETNIGESNVQYYPNRGDDVVSTISTMQDLFDYDPFDPPVPNYFPQFYLFNSNPLIARVSTNKQIGQLATTNYAPVSAEVATSSTSDEIFLRNIVGNTANIAVGDNVTGGGLPSDIVVVTPGFTGAPVGVTTATTSVSTSNIIVITSATGIQANQLATATGIPSGTIVQSISGLNITLSNVVDIGNNVNVVFQTPAKIKVGKLNDATPPVGVAEPVSVTFDARLTIVNSDTPGIQYLAVMETEPVESLLDIFWETTSTGLITDLNTLMLNSSAGGAGLSSFNSSLFKESLPTTSTILDGDFTLVNNFGTVIPAANIVSIVLTSVVNGFNDPVNYFTLDEVGTTKFFNVNTTADYYSNVFFGTTSELRTFVLNFTSTTNVGGVTAITQYAETIILENVDPIITAATPASGSTLETTRYTTTFATLDGVNGANNTTLRTQDLDWSIVSVFDTAGATPTVNIQSSNYFTLPTSVLATQKRAILTNNAIGSMPPSTYEINLKLSDAGAVDATAQYTLKMGVTPDSMKALEFSVVCQGDADGNSVFLATEVTITGQADADQNGSYIFPGPLSFWLNQSGNSIITIDRTNATTNTGYNSCPSGNNVLYAATSAAVRTLFTGGDCTCTPDSSAGSFTEISNISIAPYEFEII